MKNSKSSILFFDLMKSGLILHFLSNPTEMRLFSVIKCVKICKGSLLFADYIKEIIYFIRLSFFRTFDKISLIFVVLFLENSFFHMFLRNDRSKN